MKTQNGSFELAYDIEGEGPDLLMIVGTASSRPLWALVRPALARSFRTIAFDNRDCGESTIAGEPYGFSELAADAVAVLNAAGARKAHVLGHSMGGAIAQQFALDFPERVASLTLACTWARSDTYTNNVMDLMFALTRDVRDDRTLLAAIINAGAGATTLRNASLFEMTDAAMALGPLAPRDALARQWRLNETVDFLDRIGSIAAPVLVVTGNEDRLLPSYLSEQIANAIPGATLARIEAAGHVPMVHAPDAFAAAVLSFLTAVESTEASKP